jgi:hypothetical protein
MLGEQHVHDNYGDIAALARHLSDRREALLLAWQHAVKRDPTLTDGESLPRAALYDHIPAMLAAFERGLRQAAAGPEDASESAGLESGAAHGLQRWHPAAKSRRHERGTLQDLLERRFKRGEYGRRADQECHHTDQRGHQPLRLLRILHGIEKNLCRRESKKGAKLRADLRKGSGRPDDPPCDR